MVSLFTVWIAGFALTAADAPAPRAHFHHVHLNTTNISRSIEFYADVFGGVPVKYGDAADGIFAERSFILFDLVETAPRNQINTGIWHIGWGGVDLPHEYEWLKAKGVPIHTPLSPLPGQDNFYTYLQGPSGELIEINTMGHHRFAHVHLFSSDVNAVTQWYDDHLGLTSRRGHDVPKPSGNMSTLDSIWINSFQCDNVLFIVFGKPDVDPPPPWWPDPPLKAIEPTKGHAIDHIAFSFRDIDPVFARMKSANAQIIEGISRRSPYGFRSFFVLGPDQVLIEIVEAKPIPDAAWE